MTKIQELIAKFRKQREEKVKAMEALHQKSVDEGRGLDESEQAGFDDAQTTIAGLDLQIKNAETMEGMLLTKSVEVVDANGDQIRDRKQHIVVERNLPKGTAFTRYAMALAAARGNTMQAAEIAKARFSKDTPEVEMVIRAAVAAGNTTDTTWAAPLAAYTNMAGEFIELMRPETIMGKMTGFKTVPFQVRIPRQTAGSTAGWVGEGSPKPLSALAFDSIIIPHTKVAVIVAITEELARFSSPSAEATVQSDLIASISQFLDGQMFDPSIAGTANVSPASITFGAPSFAATGGAAPTVAQVTSDLMKLVTAMWAANIPQRNRYWILNPRTVGFLMSLRTTQDIYGFRDEMLQGRLLGIPYIMSANIGVYDSDPGVGVTNSTTAVLVEASEIFVADDAEVMLDVSREASLQMNDAPSSSASAMVSLWQNNMVGIRAERYIYWMRRRDAAVQVLTAVGY